MPGGTSSTSTSKPVMPGYLKNYVKPILKDAKKAYGKGPYYYKGSTVTPMSDQTTSALNGMTSSATANMGGAGMSGPLQDILNRGGFTAGQQETMGSMRDLMNNPFFSNTINSNGLSADQNLVADKYRTGMNEQFGLDPAYLQVKQNALDSTAQGVTAQAAKAGRYGGGANQNILSRAQGDLSANMDVGERDKWLARTNAAAGNLSGLAQTGFGNRMGAASQQGALQGQLFNSEQAGIQNMANAYQTMQQPYQTQRQVGQEYEDLYSRNMQDTLRKFDAKNPFNHLQQYLSLGSGQPTGTVQSSSPSLAQLIPGGLLAASAFL